MNRSWGFSQRPALDPMSCWSLFWVSTLWQAVSQKSLFERGKPTINSECSTSRWVYQRVILGGRDYSWAGEVSETSIHAATSLSSMNCKTPRDIFFCMLTGCIRKNLLDVAILRFTLTTAYRMPNHNSAMIDRTPMIIDDAWLIMIQHFGCLLLGYSGSRK